MRGVGSGVTLSVGNSHRSKKKFDMTGRLQGCPAGRFWEDSKGWVGFLSQHSKVVGRFWEFLLGCPPGSDRNDRWVSWFISPTECDVFTTHLYRDYNPVSKYDGHPSRAS